MSAADNKRKALHTILAKLRKLLPHLGNDNAHEAAAALGKINRLLKSAGLDWHDVIGFIDERDPVLLDILMKLFAQDDDLLIQIAHARGKFFHSATANWADVDVDGHRHTLLLPSPEFSEWLLHQFFLEKKKAPKPSALKSAIQTLGAHARYDGERREVFLRAARVDGRIYIDLGDTDWNVVEIDQTGWRMINMRWPQ
jgi:hypothetical protein